MKHKSSACQHVVIIIRTLELMCLFCVVPQCGWLKMLPGWKGMDSQCQGREGGYYMSAVVNSTDYHASNIYNVSVCFFLQTHTLNNRLPVGVSVQPRCFHICRTPFEKHEKTEYNWIRSEDFNTLTIQHLWAVRSQVENQEPMMFMNMSNFNSLPALMKGQWHI